MTEPAQTLRHESRWSPALAILVVLGLLAVLPHHVHGLPVWVAHLAALAVPVAMTAVTLAPANTLWRRIERLLIILLAAAYVANTIVELVDMIGVITLHPSKSNAFSLLSSSVAIWVANILTFSLLYWQIDGGGRMRGRTRCAASQIGSFRKRRHLRTGCPTGDHCSSTISFWVITRRRRSALPMPCR